MAPGATTLLAGSSSSAASRPIRAFSGPSPTSRSETCGRRGGGGEVDPRRGGGEQPPPGAKKEGPPPPRIALVVDPVKRVARRHAGDPRGETTIEAGAFAGRGHHVGRGSANEPYRARERHREAAQRVDRDRGELDAERPEVLLESLVPRPRDGDAEVVRRKAANEMTDLARPAPGRCAGEELQDANHAMPFVSVESHDPSPYSILRRSPGGRRIASRRSRHPSTSEPEESTDGVSSIRRR